MHPHLAAAAQSQIDTVFHAYLIKPASSRYVLFDTGCGTGFGDIAGFLPKRLAALGVGVDQIETLVFSHLHSDHCGGAIADDAPVFATADVILHADEPAVWDGGDFAANTVLAAYASRLSTVVNGQGVAPGITAWALPGHTAGHMGLRIGEGLVLCADILHSDALQLADPTVASIYDDDPERARVTRRQALDEIAERDLVFSGSHGSHMDKFRKLRRVGTGYEAIAL